MSISAANAVHISVLKEEVLEGLNPQSGGYYLDGTLGLGGHSRALLEKLGGNAHLCGLDRDTQALERAAVNLEEFSDKVHLFHSTYADFEDALKTLGWKKLDGVLLDLGVSSLQLDVAERGFSLHADGALDMRMNAESYEDTAGDFVNKADFTLLRNTIATLGEDPQAGRIARAIIDERQKKSIETTTELAQIVWNAYPAKWRATARNHPATRTFQAIRMKVNNELEQLEHFLDALLPYLNVGARVVIISFHSLEDRIVKHKFRTWSEDCLCSKQLPVCICHHKAEMKLITKKPITPTVEESRSNPRSSSAKLRVAEFLGLNRQ